MRPCLKSYYENRYRRGQLQADIQRSNRLRFCFPSHMKNKRIASVGSGPGVDIEFLSPENEVHAIDILDEALQIAESKGLIPHEIDLNGNLALPFENEWFDVVIATDILEHLFEPKRLLLEIGRVLRADGFVILSVPNHFYWKRRLSIFFGGGIVLPFHNSKQWDYFHIRFFTSKGFEELLDEAGFSIVQRHYDHFITIPRGLPRVVDRKLAVRFPDLFSFHFLVKALKKQPDI